MKSFTNREQAGQELARKLRSHITEDTVILGVPRGGIPVAFEVARSLNRPLDLLAVKKIGVPDRPEVALGAISEDGIPYLDEVLIRQLNVSKTYIQQTSEEKLRQLKEMLIKLRGAAQSFNLKQKDIIIVDDGIATGATLKAAVSVLRKRGVRKITLAAPVGARQSIEELKKVADEVVTLISPDDFVAVGFWYETFPQVTEKEVIQKLETLQYLHFPRRQEIILHKENLELHGDWTVVENERGLIIFALVSGDSRLSLRNQYIANEFNKSGFSTLLFDLLAIPESLDRHHISDIETLSQRLLMATDEILKYYKNKPPHLAYFGVSTGAAAALSAAPLSQHTISAVVSRSGRPDLAEQYLGQVTAPTLFIVGAEDKNILRLNQKALSSMENARLVNIPGATHIEESTAMEEVIEYAIQWFSECIQRQQEFPLPQELVVSELVKRAHPIQDSHSWDQLVQSLAKSRVVMLGEASHGTQEFYNIRRYISERLIQEHGFNFIAVEGDWPDCQKLNDYIRTGKGESARKIMKQFERWPTWMWANDEIANLIEWMKQYGVSFYGLDVYSLFDSLDYLNEFSHRLDPESAAAIHRLYECFAGFKKDEKAYARALTRFQQDCSEEAIANLRQLLRLRIENINGALPYLFNAQQNARIVARAEEYYRAMISGGPESWNIRDEHMIDTLEHLMRHEGANSKCIVWAHNSHVGDYHATEMREEGYVNLGGLARERFGSEQVALVGFGTYEGKVLAGPAWYGPETRMSLPAARPASFEAYCHKAARNLKTQRFYVLFDEEARKSVLGTRKYGHRAVGVVYQNHFEEHGRNYVQTTPAKRYDAFVFVDKTTALISVPSSISGKDIPETWPGGL